ncbi:hypothetical protein GGQ85_002311 [Nitrobacter vulgaris]|nr:hypothetical protein [Nitrobacter vulgaris]
MRTRDDIQVQKRKPGFAPALALITVSFKNFTPPHNARNGRIFAWTLNFFLASLAAGTVTAIGTSAINTPAPGAALSTWRAALYTAFAAA